jgi:Flp pilus assembly protein TadD
MTDTPALAAFKRGVNLLQAGLAVAAVEHFRRAVELEKRNPYYLSFLGLSLARSRQKWPEAIELCKTALRLKHNEAQFYLNMAEVYSSAGMRWDAVEILDRALISCQLDLRVKRARTKLGERSSPVLPFLGRHSFVNRNLGKLRHRALKLLRKRQET